MKGKKEVSQGSRLGHILFFMKVYGIKYEYPVTVSPWWSK